MAPNAGGGTTPNTLPRSTLRRWRRRYREEGLPGAAGQGPTPQAGALLRRWFPAFGKDRLAPLLRGHGCQASVSTVGRILPYLGG